MMATVCCMLAALLTAAVAAPTAPAYGDTVTEQITASTNFTQDTSIDLTTDANWTAGAIAMNDATSATTADDGVSVSIYTKDSPGYGRGLYARNGGSIALNKVEIHTIGDAIYGTSLGAGAGASITVGDDSSLVSQTASAAYAGPKSTVTIGNKAYLKTSAVGESSAAAYAEDGTIVIGNGATLVTDDEYVTQADDPRMAVYSWAVDADASITIGDDSSIVAKGAKNNYGLYAVKGSILLGDNANIEVEGFASNGVRTTGNSDAAVTIGNNANIKVSGDKSYGILAQTGSTVTVGSGSTISALGSGAYGVSAQADAQVNLLGDQTIVVDPAASYSMVTSAASSGLTERALVSGDGKLNILGSMYTGTAGDIDLTFRDGSLFTGSAIPQQNDGTINFAFHDTGLWDMTGSSALTSLQMASGTVDMSGADLGAALRVGTLSGEGGTFVMKTDLVAGSGNLLSAEKSGGNHLIAVKNSGNAETTGTEKLTLVETGDGVAEFGLTNEIALGFWKYGLRRAEADANNWELYATGEITPVADAAVNTFTGAYLLSYAETQTLMQRLGDLRDTPYLSGAWFRVFGGKMESNSSSFVKGFEMDYGGVQIGYDRRLENSWKGDTYVGGYFGYSKGDLDYNTEHGNTDGSGTVDSKTLGTYMTYVQDDGFYADALVKYMWMKNDFDVLDTDGEHVTGDELSTGGLGISLELGKRFRMARNEKGGNWYIEPQMQYSYTHQDGGYYYASNGLRIGVDSFTSSMGRLGVLIGYETAKTNFYAKASYVKKFDGDVNIVANDQDIPENFGDSWWVYGVGFTSRVNERNSVYMSIERSEGGKFDEPWKAYAGWRISF